MLILFWKAVKLLVTKAAWHVVKWVYKWWRKR